MSSKRFWQLGFFVVAVPAFSSSVPLDHFYLRMPTETYLKIGQDKKLLESNLFYPDMHRNQTDYTAHYLNGLRSYVEFFDAAKMDSMKYVDGIDVGLGFLSEDHKKFDALCLAISQGVKGCQFERMDFGKSHYFICKQGRLRIHVFQRDPENEGDPEPTRKSGGDHFRKFGGYTKIPTADEITRLRLQVSEGEARYVDDFLRVLGWEKTKGSVRCLNSQCLVVETTDSSPWIPEVIFSTTTSLTQSFVYPHLRIVARTRDAMALEFPK